MNLITILKDHNSDFIKICASHRVEKIYTFGSSITNHFDPVKSDIDLIVELDLQDPIEYGETLLYLWNALESFFDRKVDLLTEESIQNPYLRKSIEATKKLIYDGQSEKVLV